VGSFDEIDHTVLMTLLRKKIKDERFLNLIQKLLKAGYMDLHGERKDSLIGTPQGSIVSPILANVYLHELDECVEKQRTKREKGQAKRRNPVYHALGEKKRKMGKKGKTKTRECKDLVHKMRSLPSQMVNDPEYIRIKYLRYADDWIIGVWGNRALAEDIKQEIKHFLGDQLKLTLSEEKTRITHAVSEEASFLGTVLRMGNGRDAEAKVTLSACPDGKKVKRRSTGWETVMRAPTPKLVKKLSEKGFCTKNGTPTSKTGWSCLDADQIVQLYSSVNRGLQNYYRFADNWAQLSWIQYILEYSLAKTLAQKFKSSVRKVFKRFGKNITIVIKGNPGKKDRKVSFYLNHDWSRKREAFQPGSLPDIDRIRTAMRMETRSKLGKPCCVCGETAGQIVMHHVRHIRKLSHKREARGFNRILRAINRKQIPVCTICHGKIHRGEYDGVKLTELAYIPR